MKILIIGSEGFIGKHLVRYFSTKHDVFGADLLDIENSSYAYYKVSRMNPDYSRLFNNEKFDVCINAAGSGSVPESFRSPTNDFKANVIDTFSILNAISIHNNKCKFIYFSSAAVYGNPLTLPIKESDNVAPLSPYGWHKLLSENICKEFYAINGVKSTILRPFSVYGPGLKKQIIWDLYQKVKSSENITLYGTGSETRDFIYVKDLILSVDRIIEKAGFECEIFNVASGTSISIDNLAKDFVKAGNFSNTVNFSDQEREGDPKFWRADISKLSALGYNAGTSIIEGLKETIKWMKENE